MTIGTWISIATTHLTDIGIKTAKLDAELILAHTLRKPRTWLHMYRDEELADRMQEIADARLQLRLDRVPLAYITGHREFYGRRFYVSPSTLIPRPESEIIIETLKMMQSHIKPGTRLVDIGTGSGCLGITAKLEYPILDVTLTDISKHALTIARKNAEALSADVTCQESDLLTNYPFQPDIILANLPYVDPSWERSPETDHEPSEALFAAKGGLALIYKLIEQAKIHIAAHGLLLLEADPEQHDAISQYGLRHQFDVCYIKDYCIVLQRQ